MKKKLKQHTETMLTRMVEFINQEGIQKDDILILQQGRDGLYMLLYYV